MAKTKIGANGFQAERTAVEASLEALAVVMPDKPAAAAGAVKDQALACWSALKIAVIDDAINPPRLKDLLDADNSLIEQLLTEDGEVLAELAALGCKPEDSVDDRLGALAASDALSVAVARIGELSATAQRMFDEHRVYRRLVASLRREVAEVVTCDPLDSMPDLTTCNLVLLDYYLEGPAKGGDLAVSVATSILGQSGRKADQQIVLMSSLESVRQLRVEFRAKANVTGAAFAFVSKPDLNENWKIKAHLGMLERARPYAPAFIQYRSKLDETLIKAKDDLLALVDDLDIGDYAFLQSRALMKDGHPLGDYVFWLLSSQHQALAFESDEMRERQRALDKLEFVGEPFAATEPSTIVANLLHSALVSANIGPLSSHPRAKTDGKFAAVPLVQLGDVFFDQKRTKAFVVMSAACDLAFAPTDERPPDPEMPVMLVPGTTVKLRDAKDKDVVEVGSKTDGIVHREEVYRINWNFSKYRSVALGQLKNWLHENGYNVDNRDRLRPLFALKLQQEFGSHLFRVGPPIVPPVTNAATGKIFVCNTDRQKEREFSPNEIMLSHFKGTTLLRITPVVASALKAACEVLHRRLLDMPQVADPKGQAELDKKISSLFGQISNDDFWIGLIKGVEIGVRGALKPLGPLGFVLGDEWRTPSKPCVVLEVGDAVSGIQNPSSDAPAQADSEPEPNAMSGAG